MEKAAPASCRNCGAPGPGPYCSRCGERFQQPTDFSLRHLLLRDLPRELTEVDGKLLSSLRYLITRPGFLAAEYVAGRRRRFIGPLRLLIVVFLFHAFALAAWPSGSFDLADRARQSDPTGLVVRLAHSEAPPAYWRRPQVGAWVADRGHWISEVGTVAIALVVAVAQQIMFRRPPRRYLEHAVLAMSVTTFYVLVVGTMEFALGMVRGASSGPLDQTLREIVGGTVFVVYWLFAIRRFYGAGPVPSLLATLVISSVQAFTAMALNVAILAALVLAAAPTF